MPTRLFRLNREKILFANLLLIDFPYLTNISTPVASIFLFIPFHDDFNLNACRAVNGSRGSTGVGCCCSVFLLLAASETFVCWQPMNDVKYEGNCAALSSTK